MRLFLALFLILLLLPALAHAAQIGAAQAAFLRGDVQAALKLWQPLAEQGSAEAQERLGMTYSSDGELQQIEETYKGKLGSAEQDYANEMKWLHKAADQGYAPAQLRIGEAYAEGHDVKKDAVESAKWFQKALKVWQPLADQGNADAQRQIGRMYERGQGVKRDFAEALIWFRKAADQGNPEAQDEIGVMYAYGLGIKKDRASSLKWLQKAADQGEYGAQLNLSTMYGMPEESIKPDYAEAYFWGTLADKAVGRNGRTNEIYTKHLTPEQIAAVDKRVAEWIKSHPAPAAAPPVK